ncbi:MAG: hypothetical protein OXU20_20370 [Myxococcales bacterium]|nr:hypothetical protein [Myxococcales bacterium]
MSGQVQRLQSLLETVQRNRAQPRPARVSPADGAGARAEGVAEPQPVSLVAEAPAPPRAAAKPVPSGMPQAEPRTAPMPKVQPAAPAPPQRAAPAPPAPPNAAKRKATASPLMAALDESLGKTVPPAPLAAPTGPQQIPLPPTEQGSKPVAQVVSAAPSVDELTFGELLHRSLSLRPR